MTEVTIFLTFAVCGAASIQCGMKGNVHNGLLLLAVSRIWTDHELYERYIDVNGYSYEFRISQMQMCINEIAYL